MIAAQHDTKQYDIADERQGERVMIADSFLETAPHGDWRDERNAPDCWHGIQMIETLGRLAACWQDRAAVKKPELEIEWLLDDDKPDYLIELLPFADHPDFQNAPEEFRNAALSCGWPAKVVSMRPTRSSTATIHSLPFVGGSVPISVNRTATGSRWIAAST